MKPLVMGADRLFPLAMAVASVCKSAHNAYQLRLPAVLWLKMETGSEGRMVFEERKHHLRGNRPHKETHTAVMLDCWNRKLGEITIENKPAQFHKLTRKVSRFVTEEKTAIYGIVDVKV